MFRHSIDTTAMMENGEEIRIFVGFNVNSEPEAEDITIFAPDGKTIPEEQLGEGELDRLESLANDEAGNALEDENDDIADAQLMERLDK